LIISDKAYAPTTVRFINAFHVSVEALALLLFIAEFACLWKADSCSARHEFSFHNAIVKGVLGPTTLDVFFGHAYMAMTRLRVFGLVRHWKNMWITNSFMNTKYRMKRGGFLSTFIPSFGARNSHERKSLLIKDDIGKEAKDEKVRELTLTNASNIGTALIVTNSYRALILLWTILGLFPLIMTLSSTMRNRSAQDMTVQLQSTNLIASDTSDETCLFLQHSLSAWVKALSSTSHGDAEYNDPFLLSLVMTPYRCGLTETKDANGFACDLDLPKAVELSDPFLENACQRWSFNDTDWSNDQFANAHGRRVGSISLFEVSDFGNFTVVDSGSTSETEFSVLARFDLTETIRLA
jgi:hypothetical protein